MLKDFVRISFLILKKEIKYRYDLVSSKNGHNFDYVIHKIKKIKEKALENNMFRPKFYVVGNANVGKSSFINKLIQSTNKFISEGQRNKVFYKKNLPEKIEESNLTASPLPGTTIGVTRVVAPSLGIKVLF